MKSTGQRYLFLLLFILATGSRAEEVEKFRYGRDLYCRSEYEQANKCYQQHFDQLPLSEKVNYAESLLGAGRYVAGFKLFDERLKMSAETNERDRMRRIDALVNQWDGSDPAGKTILVRAEFGIGDLFFFASYMVVLKQLGAKVIFHLGDRGFLKEIFSLCPYIDAIVTNKDSLLEFDHDVFIMSLPRYVSSEGLSPTALYPYDTIPKRGLEGGGWMHADSALVNEWQKIVSSNKFNIGICWQASKLPAGQTRQLQRDIPLRMLAELAEIPGVRLYSLLGRFGDVEGFEHVVEVVRNENGQPKDSFSDVAAAMVNMDLVISVATSVSCLAGAMHAPIWFLNPRESDWRWLSRDYEYSPWYPTARLFRQQKQGEWEPVVQRVMQEVKTLVAQK